MVVDNSLYKSVAQEGKEAIVTWSDGYEQQFNERLLAYSMLQSPCFRTMYRPHIERRGSKGSMLIIRNGSKELSFDV
jgi:hypothetical protein